MPSLRPPPASSPPAPEAAGHQLTITCFGAFSLSLDGREVDLQGLKPRVRSLLRLLCLHAGSALHRERIQEWLWPRAGTESANTSLHVAISSLRRHLGEEPRQEASLIVRDGESYRIAFDKRSTSDVVAFKTALLVARRSQPGSEARKEALDAALEYYRGDLLSEEGASGWVVEERERHRLEAVQAAAERAALALAEEDVETAIARCRRGMDIDPYHDPLWRSLMLAHEATGNAAQALRVKADYERMLGDLGISPESALVP